MEYSPKRILFAITLLAIFLAQSSAEAADESIFEIATTSTLELNQWQNAAAIYGEDLGEGTEEHASIDGAWTNRRSLFWGKVFHYYISYGALAANRVPCPPRSGRSYYTHNCFKARSPVNPYTRGCSAITRCRR